jgi:membrane protease subunit HflK
MTRIEDYEAQTLKADSGGGGGPWGGSGGQGGGSGGGSGGPKSPWGQFPPRKPPGGGGGGGGPTGPSFEDFIRRGQEKFRGGIPGGGNPNIWRWVILGLVVLWLVMTSFYRIDAAQRGVVTRLGKYVTTSGPGLHLKLPAPIDTVTKLQYEKENAIQIGSTDAAQPNLMLTGDQNIIDIAYTVRWKIRDPELYLFQLSDPDQTIREVGESAMREAISAVGLSAAIGPQRQQIADQVRDRMQELLNSYRAGVQVRAVEIRQADPPQAVDDAFKEVSAAQQEAEQYLNQARAYAQQLLAGAQGATAEFDAVYEQYRLSPDVTRKRIYFETMENVLSKVDKTVVEAQGVQTYLPLSEVGKRQQPATAPAAAATAGGR